MSRRRCRPSCRSCRPPLSLPSNRDPRGRHVTIAGVSDLPLADHSSTADWRPALASALLATALFAVTLGGTYIYDDLYVIGIDARLRDPSQWGKYWTKDYFNGGVDN